MTKKIIASCIVLLSFLAVEAQFLVTGQDPHSVKWKQIKTENFKFIYPDYAEQSAQKFARSLTWAYQNGGKDLDSTTRKLNVILHSDAATSNAMVAWAPARMELFNTPPQDNYAQEWYEQLAVHEFRHAVQIDKLNVAMTKTLYFLFGEQITAGVLGLYIPSWFLEGDAVWAETKFSDAGRGRLASFNYDLKAQLLDKKIYNYNKAVLGSYKNYVPNQYVLGYHMVAYGNKCYGENFWPNALENTGVNPYMIVPFAHSIKKQSGLSKTQFYKKSLSDIKENWALEQKKSLPDSSTLMVKSSRKVFTSYNFPHYINDSTLFCLKQGINDISRFVSINIHTKKEEILFTPGYSNFDAVHCVDSTIIWSELRVDKRWEHRQYWVLMKYDLRKKKAKQLTKATKYFAPDLNADATKIVCVEVSKEDNYSLVVLSAKDGSLIKKLAMENFLMTPSWMTDENYVVATRQNKNGSLELVKINLNTAEIFPLMPETKKYISSPLVWENFLLFTAEYAGTPNIYALDTITKNVFQVSSVKYKLADVVSYSNKLLFSDYTADGYQIRSQTLIPQNWTPLEKVKNNFYWIVSNDSLSLNPNIASITGDTTTYASNNYKKLPHLFNIHSWGPLAISGTNIGLNPGLNFSSQNLLSTLVTQFGYEYQRNIKTNKFYANLSYMAWYPVIDFRLESAVYPIYNGNRLLYLMRQNSVELSASLPSTFNTGKFTYHIRPILGVGYLQQKNLKNESNPYTNFKANTFTAQLFTYRLMKTSVRDLTYRRGQILSFTAGIATTTDFKVSNKLLFGKGIFYFPGIGKHHSIVAKLELQKATASHYYYALDQLMDYPRGYTNQALFSNAKFFSIDYKLPLLYPDLSLGSILYVKRVHASLFFDDIYTNQDRRSYGAELYFDVHLFRFVAPLSFGTRYAIINYGAAQSLEFLFSINFNAI